MAYLSYLASVPESQLSAIRADASVRLQPSLLVPVSHAIAYWVKVQPLSELLGRAIDGGEMLNDNLTHPFRSPTFHTVQRVRLLHRELTAAWQDALRSKPGEDIGSDMWYRMEIGRALKAFQHAAEHDECVVSAIDPRRYIFSGNASSL
jgi:hypothetical protein